LLGAVAIADQMGVPYVKGWPYAFVGLLGVFLLLQLLTLIFKKEPQGQSPAPTQGE
jgi:hypothetical protein